MNHPFKPVRTPAQLGIALKERRMQLGDDQSTVANKAGITRAWLAALEKGTAGASIGIVLRVLNALGLSMTISTSEAEQRQTQKTKSNIQPVHLNTVIDRLRNAPNK
jgi:HTH-type transcriptional regulator/antitoxin HipB